MMGGNHAVSGAAVWLAVTSPAVAVPWLGSPLSAGMFGLDWQTVLAGAVVTAGGALLPDIDHHDATIAHAFPGGGIVARLIGGAAGGHRKGTHSLLGSAVLGVSVVLLSFIEIGGWPVGVAIVGACVAAFALKSLRVVWFVRSWFAAWVAGALVGYSCVLLVGAAGGDVWWLDCAVIGGAVVHVVGDALTVGGVPPLYPWLPKPPEAVANTPLLNRMWQKNGYVGIPVLGRTGSALEWLFGVLLGAYVLLVSVAPLGAAKDSLVNLARGVSGGVL